MGESGKDRVKDYIRVRISYYKLIEVDDGVLKRTELIPWDLKILREDFSKEERAKIPKYDGFIVLPSHTDYQQSVRNFYNIYSPIIYRPCAGSCETIKEFIKHIFGEQYELGLDYLQLLYTRPMQRLPILLLVSETQGTGKTTFLNFLAEIFQSNAVPCTSENFKNKFNLDWTGKLLVYVDEALLNRREDYEMIKYKSTATTMKMEGKGENRYDLVSFTKFIFCSNDINRPICIERGDTRFWVRNIPTFKSEITDLLEKLKQEIPAFLYFLTNRELSVPSAVSRMWFSPADIRTEALERIISFSVNPVERELFEFISDMMIAYELDVYRFSIRQLITLMKRESIDIKSSVIKNLLRRRSIPDENSSYKTLIVDETTGEVLMSETFKGRFYSITREQLEKIL